jgi:hypothetical protein
MSNHLNNIELFKKSLRKSVGREFELGVKNLDVIEDRLRESKNQIKLEMKLNEL